jgi:hypothetical protein
MRPSSSFPKVSLPGVLESSPKMAVQRK